MTMSVALAWRSIAIRMLIVVTFAALLATVAVALWSVLGPQPQLIAPTRWLEAVRTFA